MALNRYVDVLINNKDCKATLKEPLVVFEKDKNAHIYFRLVDYRYQYKLTTATEDDWNIVYNLKGADAWITIVKPDGTEVEQGKEGNNVNNVILKDAYVRFILSPELTDEITEIGTYLLQIHITDKEGGEVTIPSFSFEVKERLKGTSPAATVLLLTEEGNNLTTEQGTPMVASGNGVTISSLPARNTYTGNEYMAVAFGGATYKMPTSLLKGADGITPTLKIGTVNTLPAGANAIVTATTSNNIVTLDFGIPRGADGSGGSGTGDGHTHANKTELDKFVLGDKVKLDTASTHAGTTHAPSNAEQNVQSDWNVTDTSSDAYIKNKPAIPAVTQVVDNLTSTDTNKALSANQGKVLDEKVATNASSIAEITQQTYTKIEVDKKISDIVIESGNLSFRDVVDGEIFKATETPSSNIPVTGVILNKTTTTINKGSTDILIATISPPNASNKAITWSSSNTSIATVNDGLINGISNGTCTITVTTVDGSKTATCNVTVETVTIPIISISLNKSVSTLKVDGTEQLTVTFNPTNATNKNITWTSSDETKATVVDGLVTAKVEGSVTVTATSQDGNKTATCGYTITNQSQPSTLNKISIIDETNKTYEAKVSNINPVNIWSTNTNYGDTVLWWKMSCFNETYTMFDYNPIACNQEQISVLTAYTSEGFKNTNPPAFATISNSTLVFKTNDFTEANQVSEYMKNNDIRLKFNMPSNYEKLTINGSNITDHTPRTSGVISGFKHYKAKLNIDITNWISNYSTQFVNEYYIVQPSNQNIYGLGYRCIRITNDGYLEMTIEEQFLENNTLQGVQAFLNENPIVLYRKVV